LTVLGHARGSIDVDAGSKCILERHVFA
jgi:hypothetical protein